MKLKVNCYSGYKADERPLSFEMNEKKYEVIEILDQWYGKDQTYFRIRADDGNLYILRHELEDDIWDLTFFKKGDRNEI